MPIDPRVTYWTGWLSPEMEGCSKEVFALKAHFRRSRIFGLSHAYTMKASRRDRYFGLSAKLYPLFRLLAPFWDVTSDVNHIYGDLGEWFFLRAVHRRPLVMTVATATSPLARDEYAHVSRFVTHGPGATRRLIGWGFDPARISQIYPGIDLARFRPGPRGADPPVPGPAHGTDRFRVLFATTPHVPEGMRTRGVDLMLAAARELPDVDFIMLWRPLPGSEPLVERCRREATANVHVSTHVVGDMPEVFRACDATIAPFVEEDGMKVCPTSLIESLASGRPVLVSTKVGIGDLLQQEGCGEVFEPTVEGLRVAIVRLRSNYDDRAKRARDTAERHFDADLCHAQYRSLYAELLAEPGSDPGV